MIRDAVDVRSLYRAEWSELRTASAVEEGLDVLSSLGWLRVVERPSPTRAARVVRLHPDLRGKRP